VDHLLDAYRPLGITSLDELRMLVVLNGIFSETMENLRQNPPPVTDEQVWQAVETYLLENDVRHIQALFFPLYGEFAPRAAGAAQEIQASLQQGGDFQTVWDSFANATSGGPQRYEFPAALRKDLKPELAEPAFLLAGGQVSGVIATGPGLFILHNLGSDSPALRRELFDRLKVLLDRKAAEDVVIRYLLDLRSTALVIRADE